MEKRSRVESTENVCGVCGTGKPVYYVSSKKQRPKIDGEKRSLKGNKNGGKMDIGDVKDSKGGKKKLGKLGVDTASDVKNEEVMSSRKEEVGKLGVVTMNGDNKEEVTSSRKEEVDKAGVDTVPGDKKKEVMSPCKEEVGMVGVDAVPGDKKGEVMSTRKEDVGKMDVDRMPGDKKEEVVSTLKEDVGKTSVDTVSGDKKEGVDAVGDKHQVAPSSGQLIKFSEVQRRAEMADFWIQCDTCAVWFHGKCVNVEDYEGLLIEHYHCKSCVFKFGPSVAKPAVLDHRYAFDDIHQFNQPTQVGTKRFIAKFRKDQEKIPVAADKVVAVFENGSVLAKEFSKTEEWKKPILIRDSADLGMKLPAPGFSVKDCIEILGADRFVSTIDVYAQRATNMSLGRFYELFTVAERPRLYNIISLECSDSRMRELVEPPQLVRDLSWVHQFWPDSENPWTQSSSKSSHGCPVMSAMYDTEKDFRELHLEGKPQVSLYCLIGMKGSYTDFHIDLSGTSVWYHVYAGQKIFYLVEPTKQALRAYMDYSRNPNMTEIFFGDVLAPGAVSKIVINTGETLMLPSGWLHAVYTPCDSLVFGGNFLHSLNISMQLRVREMEIRLKTEHRLMFPSFELTTWYAAASLLDTMRGAKDKNFAIERFVVGNAKALAQQLNKWMTCTKKNTTALGNKKQFANVLSQLVEAIKACQGGKRSRERARAGRVMAEPVASLLPEEATAGRMLADPMARLLPDEAAAGGTAGDPVARFFRDEAPTDRSAGDSVTSLLPEEASPGRTTAGPVRNLLPEKAASLSSVSLPIPESSVETEANDDGNNEMCAASTSVENRQKARHRTNTTRSNGTEDYLFFEGIDGDASESGFEEGINLASMFATTSHHGRTPRPSAWLAQAANEQSNLPPHATEASAVKEVAGPSPKKSKIDYGAGGAAESSSAVKAAENLPKPSSSKGAASAFGVKQKAKKKRGIKILDTCPFPKKLKSKLATPKQRIASKINMKL